MNGQRQYYTVMKYPTLMYEPVDLIPFCPISSLNEKLYPRNINYMPAVKFLICLDIEQKGY